MRLCALIAVTSCLLAGTARGEQVAGWLAKLSVHGYLSQAYAVSDDHQIFGIPTAERGLSRRRTAAPLRRRIERTAPSCSSVTRSSAIVRSSATTSSSTGRSTSTTSPIASPESRPHPPAARHLQRDRRTGRTARPSSGRRASSTSAATAARLSRACWPPSPSAMPAGGASTSTATSAAGKSTPT